MRDCTRARDEIKKQLERDVESYNAFFPNAPAKQIKRELELVPFLESFQKSGDSPTGHLSVSFSQDASGDGDRQISDRAIYRFRLNDESHLETAKEQVQRILEVLPDDVSFEDIQYHIYVRQRVDQGFGDEDTGRLVSHEEALRRLDEWRR